MMRLYLSPQQVRLHHCGTSNSITAERAILSRRHERLHHLGTKDSITAARETQSRRHERLHHRGTKDSFHCGTKDFITAGDSITAAREIPYLSWQHKRFLMRLYVSLQQGKFYHGGTSDSITAVRQTLSRRRKRLNHGGA